jgi:NhaP-type Na+/H+ or K+/H+ antiporter
VFGYKSFDSSKKKKRHYVDEYIKLTLLSVLNFLFGAELPSSAPKARLGFFSI